MSNARVLDTTRVITIRAQMIKEDQKLTPHTIVLIGMMGCGKSHIGKVLAMTLGVAFYDSDAEIESLHLCSVSDIFAKQGEPAFREIERDMIKALIAKGACVISTGGGAVTNPETFDYIKEHTKSVWLQVDDNVLWERVQGDDTRPLLQTENPKETLIQLLRKREALYKQADICVSNNGYQAKKVANEIINAINGA